MARIRPVVDFILGYDDNSTDKSREIFLNNGGILLPDSLIAQNQNVTNGKGATYKKWQEFKIRQELLDFGRKLSATHFIVLDADELFVGLEPEEIRLSVQKLIPGEKLVCDWLMAANGGKGFLGNDSVWKPQKKDFAFADHPDLKYPSNRFFHFARTPTNSGIEESHLQNQVYTHQLKVLHLQFLNWQLGQIKQCWYRAQECLKLGRDFRTVNSKYHFTKELPANYMLVPLGNSTEINMFGDEIKKILQFNPKDSWFYSSLSDMVKERRFYCKSLDIWFSPLMQELHYSIYGKPYTRSKVRDFFNLTYLRYRHCRFYLSHFLRLHKNQLRNTF